MTDTSSNQAPRATATVLILVAVAALAIYLFLFRQWSGSFATSGDASLVLPLIGFCIAASVGLGLGLWWPAWHDSDDAVNAAQDEPASEVTVGDVATDDTPTVSALMEEEHFVGEERPVIAETVAPDPVIGAPQNSRTPAAPMPSVAIDDMPRDQALIAKDEVIRSLENIVKENRDRWADFEQEREGLSAKIENLEAELRIAHQIIAHGGDDSDVFVPPQVLSRV